MGNKNLPMRIVRERTGLSSRQIRYYEEKGLIFPARTKGKQRLFSEDDIQRLHRIKYLLEQGYSMEAVKEKLKPPISLSKESILNFTRKRDFINKGDLTGLYPVSRRNPLQKKT